MLETNEFDNPGMHTTNTVDMEIVISGEIVLELDDGVETTLRQATSTSRTAPGTAGTTAAPNPPSWPSRWSDCRDPPERRGDYGDLRRHADHVRGARIHRRSTSRSGPLPNPRQCRFAPSGGNRQGTHIVAVRDAALRERLGDLNVPGARRYFAQLAVGENPWNPVEPSGVPAEAIAGTTVPMNSPRHSGERQWCWSSPST